MAEDSGRSSSDRPVLLGTPLQVGPIELRNRIVSPPMERNYCTVDGRVTDRYVAYLRARAAGGAALLFTEATYIRADGRGRVRQMGGHSDHVIPGLRALSDAVHSEGALLGVELNHAGRVAEYYVSVSSPWHRPPFRSAAGCRASWIQVRSSRSSGRSQRPHAAACPPGSTSSSCTPRTHPRVHVAQDQQAHRRVRRPGRVCQRCAGGGARRGARLHAVHSTVRVRGR
jgi:NADH:flavin oxidoreductase / NADH oxidase family